MGFLDVIACRQDACCLYRAYHGHSKLLIDISSYKHDAPGGNGPGEFCHVVSGKCLEIIY
jgi:hypothetical protein